MGPRLIFYKGFSWVSPDCIYYLAAQHGLQNLSSPKGTNLCPLRCKRRALTTGLPGNSPIVYKMFLLENTQEREEGGERGRKRQRERERGGRGRGRGGGERGRRKGRKEGRRACERHHAGSITSSQEEQVSQNGAHGFYVISFILIKKFFSPL